MAEFHKDSHDRIQLCLTIMMVIECSRSRWRCCGGGVGTRGLGLTYRINIIIPSSLTCLVSKLPMHTDLIHLSLICF